MRTPLYLTAAIAALAASPVAAQQAEITYANNIDTSVTTDVTYTKNVALRGSVSLNGEIGVDSSAVAVNDAKQLLRGTDVIYDGIGRAQASTTNAISGITTGSNGNLGVNAAAGSFNMQMNAASIAMTDDRNGNGNGNRRGGWAEASTTSLQSLLNVGQYAVASEQFGRDNFRERNSVGEVRVGGAGNIGLNAAAGNFNQQSNLMTLAVADHSVLAEANAGLIQSIRGSSAVHQDSVNRVGGITVNRASGNIGVNVASGVGNQQLNSLTIAASSGDAPSP